MDIQNWYISVWLLCKNVHCWKYYKNEIQIELNWNSWILDAWHSNAEEIGNLFGVSTGFCLCMLFWNWTKDLYCVLAVRKHALSYFQKVSRDTWRPFIIFTNRSLSVLVTDLLHFLLLWPAFKGLQLCSMSKQCFYMFNPFRHMLVLHIFCIVPAAFLDYKNYYKIKYLYLLFRWE